MNSFEEKEDTSDMRHIILNRLHEATKVVNSWPDPTSVMQYKCSLPDMVKDDYWLSYNSEGTRADTLRVRFVPDPKQNSEAREVLEWIEHAGRRYDLKGKKQVKAILWIKGIYYYHRFGYRRIADQLSVKGINMKHTTVKRLFDRAMEDIEWKYFKK